MHLSHSSQNASKWGLFIFLLGLSLSSISALLVQNNNTEIIERALQAESLQISNMVLNRFTLYQYGLRGVRGMIAAVGEDMSTRDIFHRYSTTRDIDAEFPGALGFGFIRRVPQANEAIFLAKVRQDDWPDFQIRSFGSHDKEKYIIEYIEPVERNKAAVGLDIASEHRRQEAARSALLSGEARLSAPITLVQATGQPLHSFLILMPIYRTDYVPKTFKERDTAGFGWSYAPLVIDEVLASLAINQASTKLILIDVTDPEQAISFFETHQDDTTQLTEYQYQLSRDIFGRKWQIEVMAYPEFITNLNLIKPSLVLLVSCILSFLVAIFIVILSLSLQRKKQVLAEQARRASMLEHSLDGIISYDLEGHITSWNQGAKSLFGYLESEVIGLRAVDLIVPPSVVVEEQAWITKVLTGEVVLNQVSRHQAKDGIELSTSTTTLAIYNEHAVIVGFSQTIRNITDQQDAQQRILKLNENLELKITDRTRALQQALSENNALLESINEQLLYSVTDINGVILEVNEYFCRVSGYCPEELIGQNYSMMNSGVHDIAFWQEMWGKINSGQSWHGEICNKNKCKELKWFDTVIGPVLDDKGNVDRFVVLRTDITERKLAQIAKNKLGLLLSKLLDAATEISIIATDENGLITIFNRGAESLLGYSASEMVGKSSPAPLHQLSEVELRAAELAVEYGFVIEGFDIFVYKARTEGSETRNWTYTRKDGSHCQVSLSVTAMYDNDGGLIGYLGIAVDITDQSKLETSLRNAKKNADMASEAKSAFLANMSHEIRTPMNGVLGMLSLLLNSDLKEEQRKKASLAQSSAKSLLLLINDILDYSKVDAGKLELENLDFDVRKMVGEFAESVAIQVEEKELELILDISGIAHTLVKGDPSRLRQILSNLVGNAIKFTSQGEIVIKAKLSNFNDVKWCFECSIKDTGIGIAKDKVPTLFDSFSQADISTTRMFGGTGLGLAIAKKLCQLMGGDISITTELHQGSCFSFCVYLGKSLYSQIVIPKMDISTLSVLIVDDNTTNREVLGRQLELWGAEVSGADSGKQALKLCGSRLAEPDKRFFDIAFVDMQMPTMDGAMLGKLLQTSPHFNEIKLVMMTSMSQQVDAQYFANLGFHTYFSKPATTEDLYKVLDVVIDDNDTLEGEALLVNNNFPTTLIQKNEPNRIKDQGWNQLASILLVEDNLVNQLVVEGILEEFDVTPVLAVNGIDALEKLKNADNEFNIILMDCQMPEMDGYQTTQAIRLGKAGENYIGTTIIAMTANAMIGDKEKCIQSGMDDYLSKPIDPDKLILKLKFWLEPTESTTDNRRLS